MSDTLFYLLSKSIGFVIRIDHFLILLILLGLLLSWKWQKSSRIIIGFSASILFVLCLFPIGFLLLEPLEKRFPIPTQLPDKIGGIIILGGLERIAPSIIHQQAQFNGAAERIMIVPHLLKRYPDTQVVIASGSRASIDPNIKGAHIIAQWLKPLAPNTVRIFTEDQSRNTYQNALNAQKHKLRSTQPSKYDEEPAWILITSAAHMPRSAGIFQALNWNIIPYPVDFQSYSITFFPHFSSNISDLSRAYHEWIGLVAYYLKGYTNNLFPAPNHHKPK